MDQKGESKKGLNDLDDDDLDMLCTRECKRGFNKIQIKVSYK